MSSSDPEVPPGVVALLIDAEGHSMAEAVEFGTNRPGGLTLRQAQEYYVEGKLARNLIERSCGYDVVEVLTDRYECENIMNRLIRKKGYKKKLVYIGHDKT